MDIRMPEMDGLAATVEIRKQELNKKLKPIPIVALTAQAMTEDIDIYLSKGMNYYATKPINIAELSKILIKILPVIADNIAGNPKNSQESDKDILDVNAALDILGGSKELLHSVVKIYLDNHENLLTRIKKEINSGDAKAISDLGHLIKGSSATFGAKNVVELAATLDEMGKSGKIREASAVLKQLEIEMERLVTVLHKFQNS